jgi:hypothetical protein
LITDFHLGAAPTKKIKRNVDQLDLDKAVVATIDITQKESWMTLSQQLYEDHRYWKELKELNPTIQWEKIKPSKQKPIRINYHPMKREPEKIIDKKMEKVERVEGLEKVEKVEKVENVHKTERIESPEFLMEANQVKAPINLEEKIHIVKNKDTIQSLSQEYYKTKHLWYFIWRANYPEIKDPKNLPVGIKIKIPKTDEMGKIIFDQSKLTATSTSTSTQNIDPNILNQPGAGVYTQGFNSKGLPIPGNALQDPNQGPDQKPVVVIYQNFYPPTGGMPYNPMNAGVGAPYVTTSTNPFTLTAPTSTSTGTLTSTSTSSGQNEGIVQSEEERKLAEEKAKALEPELQELKKLKEEFDRSKELKKNIFTFDLGLTFGQNAMTHNQSGANGKIDGGGVLFQRGLYTNINYLDKYKFHFRFIQKSRALQLSLTDPTLKDDSVLKAISFILGYSYYQLGFLTEEYYLPRASGKSVYMNFIKINSLILGGNYVYDDLVLWQQKLKVGALLNLRFPLSISSQTLPRQVSKVNGLGVDLEGYLKKSIWKIGAVDWNVGINLGFRYTKFEFNSDQVTTSGNSAVIELERYATLVSDVSF